MNPPQLLVVKVKMSFIYAFCIGLFVQYGITRHLFSWLKMYVVYIIMYI